MILIKNINFLRTHFRHVREQTKDFGAKGNVKVEPAKRGSVPTLTYSTEDKLIYLHSKYNPIQEAEKLADTYEEELKEKEHVVFYGIGLGYHIEKISKRHPTLTFSLYEPSQEVFASLLETRLLEDICGKQTMHFYVKHNENSRDQFAYNVSQEVNKTVFIPLPSYTKHFKEDYQAFTSAFSQSAKNKLSSVKTNIAFKKRWTVNSLMNIAHTLQTPNILADENKRIFRNKPVIITAAGPSLNEDLDYLREVKEKGLAYIFAVGSANKVLIKNGIYPDAVCTYDPQGHNDRVFQEMIDMKIENIPMIFGTTVGYETLERYEGPKAHMLISQDTVTPYLLSKNMGNRVINDAPSIAIVTLQLLHKLGASPIILSGQNLAFKDDNFYAEGIEYKTRSQKLKEHERKNALKVASVTGEEIFTNESFNRMRENLEYYLTAWQRTDVFNTTKGGAAIEGTTYIPLSKMINERLTNQEVEENWFQQLKVDHELPDIRGKLQYLKDQYTLQQSTLSELNKVIKFINSSSQINESRLEKLFNQLDKLVKKMESNDFYQVIISPMVRVERDKMIRSSQKIKKMACAIEKAPYIVESFGRYSHVIEQISSEVNPLLLEMEKKLEGITS